MDNKKLKNLVFAHRGMYDNKEVPENSLLAFRRAVLFKQPIELDIQLTKDEKIVVVHDYNLKRLTGEDKFVGELTLDELQNCHLFHTNESIPTLEDVFLLVAGKVLLDIEIKETKKPQLLINSLLSLLENYSGEVVLKSFYPNIVRILKKKKVGYPVGLLITDNFSHKIAYSIITSSQFISLVQPDFLAISKALASKSRWQRLRKKYCLWVWTIQNGPELQKYREVADSFICNHLPYPKL